MTLTVYTKPACVQCNATYRALDKKGHNYTSIDITQDLALAELLREQGHMQAPVIFVHKDGLLIDSWSGFRPDKIADL